MLKDKMTKKSEDWVYFKNRVDGNLERFPYSSGEFAAASALLYLITAEQLYLENSIRLNDYAFHSEPDVGWTDFDKRNPFRVRARWAFLTFIWLKQSLSIEQIQLYESHFAIWGDYWLGQVGLSDDEGKLRTSDTDNVTSLVENLFLLGTILSNSSTYGDLGSLLRLRAEDIFENIIVQQYMLDIMSGGVWAEGVDYSSQTQVHWALTALIYSQLGIEDKVNDYPLLTIKALNQMTLSGFDDTYKYGSVGNAKNYSDVSEDGRYQFALVVQEFLSNEDRSLYFFPWWTKVIKKYGHPSRSIDTGIWRILFEPLDISGSEKPYDTFNKDEMFYSPGVGLVSLNYKDDDSVVDLYFINRKLRVDHEHQDALSFDIAFNGEWVTKEVSGYSGLASTSVAHNTILIENADQGSSSPTRRASGNPYYYIVHNTDDFSLLSAEAAPAYNMSGYYAAKYTEQVSRQLVFIKPNIIAIYDRVITDPNVYNDLEKYIDKFIAPRNGRYNRSVQLVQHFLKKPKVSIENPLYFSFSNKKSDVDYRILYPKYPNIKWVDEKLFWSDVPKYQINENQKNWHIKVESGNETNDSEFVTFFRLQKKHDCLTSVEINFVCELDASSARLKTKTIAKESIIEGDIIGLNIHDDAQNHTLIWNRTPSTPLERIQVQLQPTSTELLITGLYRNSQYEVILSKSSSTHDLLIRRITSSDFALTLESQIYISDESGSLKLDENSL